VIDWSNVATICFNKSLDLRYFVFTTFGDGGNGLELEEELLKVLERPAVGTVAKCVLRIVVDLEEEAGDADGDGGAGDGGHVLAETASAAAETARLLDGVSDVLNDRSAGAHGDEIAKVDNEVGVAKGGAALAEKDVGVAGVADLFGGVKHRFRPTELTLFDIDDFASLAGGNEEVGLTTEKGRNLKHVDVLGDNGGLIGLVNIGHNRHVSVGANAAQNLAALEHAGTSVRGVGRAVRLVEAGLVHERNADVATDFLQSARHHHRVFFRFDHTRAGKHKEWLGVAKFFVK
jgi:hypothetical protein